MKNEDIDDEMLVEVGYVISSKYRTKVIKSLAEDTKIPTQIAKDTDILPNHMSATLKQLKENELVECINPEVRKGRLYRLTDKGEDLVNLIN